MKRAITTEYNLNIKIKTVSKVVSKWGTNGTMRNQNKGHSGRSKHLKNEKNVAILNERDSRKPISKCEQTGSVVSMQGAF